MQTRYELVLRVFDSNGGEVAFSVNRSQTPEDQDSPLLSERLGYDIAKAIEACDTGTHPLDIALAMDLGDKIKGLAYAYALDRDDNVFDDYIRIFVKWDAICDDEIGRKKRLMRKAKELGVESFDDTTPFFSGGES